MSASPENNNIVCISNNQSVVGYDPLGEHYQSRSVVNRYRIYNEFSNDNPLSLESGKKHQTNDQNNDSSVNIIYNKTNPPESTDRSADFSVLNRSEINSYPTRNDQPIVEPLCLKIVNNNTVKIIPSRNVYKDKSDAVSHEGTSTEVPVIVRNDKVVDRKGDDSFNSDELKNCPNIEIKNHSFRKQNKSECVEVSSSVNCDASQETGETEKLNYNIEKECANVEAGSSVDRDVSAEIEDLSCNRENKNEDRKIVSSADDGTSDGCSVTKENVNCAELSSEVISLLKEAEQQNQEACSVSITSLRSALSSALHPDIQNPGNTYRCCECPWVFSSRSGLQLHLQRSHKRRFKNVVLSNEEACKRSERLKRSNVVYSRTKPFQCSICRCSFYERTELVAHGLTHSKLLKCNVCGLTFTKRKDFNTHALTHNKKPVACEICGKTFSQAGNMKIHLRIHTKEKPYICEHCGKSYAQSGDLKTHIRVHTDEKPYLCEVCGNLFHSLSHLARHSKVHTKEKPYTCKVCGKSFAHTHHLKKHYRIHTQEKPYNCEICGKAFSRADYLKQHIRVHTKEKPYICQICGKGFSQGGSLKLHQRVHARQGLLA